MRLGACIGPLATGHLMPGMMDYRAIVETARDYAIFTTDAEDRIET
ncbi:hypothetical protein [Rubellimicrobium aerolatum]|nr:hypothetical protein [Rubellimicrobium aerolatum]